MIRLPRRYGRYIKAVSDSTTEARFDWDDAVIDSIIMSGVSFFSSLSSLVATGSPLCGSTLVVPFVTACSTFFFYLALKRKLVKEVG